MKGFWIFKKLQLFVISQGLKTVPKKVIGKFKDALHKYYVWNDEY